LVEEEVEAVVVVEHHDRVGPMTREPIVDVVEAAEERRPVRLLLPVLGDRLADRRHVRGGHCADDLRHIHLPAATSFALKSSTDMPVCCAPMSWTLRPNMPASLAR